MLGRCLDTTQIRICIEGTFKLLRIDLSIFVEDVCIDLCDHIGL